MDDTSGVIMRQKTRLRPGTLLVNPSDRELLGKIPPGHFASLHYGQWLSLREQPEWDGQFGLDANLNEKTGHAVAWMPKARRELDLLLAWTQAQMNPGAVLWLVGPKRGGIESGGKALKKKLGNGLKLDSARHCQLWEFVIAEPDSPFQMSDWFSEQVIHVPLDEGDTGLEVVDMPGVFSEGRLDDGTELLLRALPRAARSPVLDFACGAGVVGAAMLKQAPSLSMTFLDVQWQALASTRQTLATNGLDAEVIPGDGLGGATGRYASIVTNPPFHSGLKTDLSIVRRFIVQAKARLLPAGELWLVANAFLPYRELLEEQFPGVEIVKENSRFRVYRAQAR